jgi:hypothetical protein
MVLDFYSAIEKALLPYEKLGKSTSFKVLAICRLQHTEKTSRFEIYLRRFQIYE